MTSDLDKRTHCHIRNRLTSPRSRKHELLENSIYKHTDVTGRPSRVAFLSMAVFRVQRRRPAPAATKICNSQQATLENGISATLLFIIICCLGQSFVAKPGMAKTVASKFQSKQHDACTGMRSRRHYFRVVGKTLGFRGWVRTFRTSYRLFPFDFI